MLKTPAVQPDPTTYGVEHAGLHIVLKKILKGDKEKKEQNEPTFGAAIAQKMSPETVIRLPFFFVIEKLTVPNVFAGRTLVYSQPSIVFVFKCIRKWNR